MDFRRFSYFLTGPKPFAGLRQTTQPKRDLAWHTTWSQMQFFSVPKNIALWVLKVIWPMTHPFDPSYLASWYELSSIQRFESMQALAHGSMESHCSCRMVWTVKKSRYPKTVFRRFSYYLTGAKTYAGLRQTTQPKRGLAWHTIWSQMRFFSVPKNTALSIHM